MTWEEAKQLGSAHYKNGEIQPFDLYRSLDPEGFRKWMLIEATQHLLRNLLTPRDVYGVDLDKVEHYVKTLKVLLEETKG